MSDYRVQEETFMHFLLEHQLKHNRTLNFLILMEQIVTAAKRLKACYQKAAIEGNLGKAGDINIQGEEVMELDQIAHAIVMQGLKESKQVLEAISEEEDGSIRFDVDGRYIIYFDPLDGSSNIRHTLPVGFMFGIAKKNLEGEEDFHLRKGRDYIAAGTFMIPDGIFTFALKDCGAWRFLLSDDGNYVSPHKIELPSAGASTEELSFNAGNLDFYNKEIAQWLKENCSKKSFRYAGSLAVDFHRLLNNGGMFCYPAIVNHPNSDKNRPKGKLRLMYECNVAAFIAEEAGGGAIGEDGVNVLDVEPSEMHQRSALYVGSKEVISQIRKILSN